MKTTIRRFDNRVQIGNAGYFSDSNGTVHKKRQTARHLAEFVNANLQRVNAVGNFERRELPDGFSATRITFETGRRYCGEPGAATFPIFAMLSPSATPEPAMPGR